ncbi:MAG: AN1-type zinc finger domain-containing protein [Candidatus Bathyarchaeia archaeon]
MAKCLKCGARAELPFVCSYCGGYFCIEHRLPESHECPGLAKARAPRQERPISRPRTRRLFQGFGATEVKHLLVAWIVIGFCFLARALWDLKAFPIFFAASLSTVGAGFLAHELSHKFVAQRFGCWAEFRIWKIGLLLALLLALVSMGRVVFAAPGAVYITPLGLIGLPIFAKRESALISLSGPLANISIAILFLSIGIFGGEMGAIRLIGEMGFRANLWLAAFNLLPFGIFDGSKIFEWKPWLWASMAIPAWVLALYAA